MENPNEIKKKTQMIASQTGCPECWGTGIRGHYNENSKAFVDECCFFCGGTGILDKKEVRKEMEERIRKIRGELAQLEYDINRIHFDVTRYTLWNKRDTLQNELNWLEGEQHGTSKTE